MRLTDWQQRKLDEQTWTPGGPAVGGITWTTCLAPTDKGPCIKGVKVALYGVPTGFTRCDEHATQEADRESLVDSLVGLFRGVVEHRRVHQATYGALNITADQRDELTNALVSHLLLEYRVEKP